ncbi:uncharacterized protein LOC144886452 [Branchiostoma floridae x Branchiostoma japonicum]
MGEANLRDTSSFQARVFESGSGECHVLYLCSCNNAREQNDRPSVTANEVTGGDLRDFAVREKVLYCIHARAAERMVSPPLMTADVEERNNICATSRRPDLVVWSEVHKTVIIVELTVPWEENMQSAYERKKLKDPDLTDESKQSGWKVLLYPVEVGCRGFPGSSLARFYREMAIANKLLRNMAEEG